MRGLCATNDGESVTLSGDERGGGGGQGTGSDGGGVGVWAPGQNGGAGGAVPVVDTRPLRDGYGVTSPVTLSDIRSFRPAPGADRMEPNGWTVVGLSTNFYAVVGVQVQDGTLLGRAASVRFTPKAYHWNYGDGSTATRATPGATWRAQGLREFDPTATSHIFRAKKTYTITLSIDFGAEYRYDGGAWTTIAGTINLPANPLTISAGDAKTVLVARDCSSSPAGPGC